LERLERFKQNCGRKKAQKTAKRIVGFLSSGRPLRLPDWWIGDGEIKTTRSVPEPEHRPQFS
jgi:hypothetical protein